MVTDEEKRKKIVEKILAAVSKEELEELFSIPCCHVTGEHDPTHFQNRKFICLQFQLAPVLIRVCKELGIDPQTRSKPDCYWCIKYGEKREGEGLRLTEGRIEFKEETK